MFRSTKGHRIKLFLFGGNWSDQENGGSWGNASSGIDYTRPSAGITDGVSNQFALFVGSHKSSLSLCMTKGRIFIGL